MKIMKTMIGTVVALCVLQMASSCSFGGGATATDMKKTEYGSAMTVTEREGEDDMSVLGTVLGISAPERKPEKTYSADSFFDSDGHLDRTSDAGLAIAFIGGSLTEGEITANDGRAPGCTNIWTNAVLEYFASAFPNRLIRAYNAGISGTTSEFGAVRFERCLLKYAPDVIFVEFAVNDSGSTRKMCQAYMESMIKQAREADKVPVIIFVYNPWPAERDSAYYRQWETGVNYKEEIASYYGIGTVNVYDYLEEKYEGSACGSFTDFLGKYYNSVTDKNGRASYDVHPKNEGYELYGKAVVSELASSPEKYFRRMNDVENSFENGAYSDILSLDFRHIAPDSERISYSGTWNFYSAEKRFDCYSVSYGYNARIPEFSYFEPNNGDGIMQTLEGGASAMFKSTPGTDGIYVQMPYSAVGNVASVTVDGEYAGEVSCHLNFYGYTGVGYVELPGDGMEHEIVLTTGKISPGYGVFRFGYIIEAVKG